MEDNVSWPPHSNDHFCIWKHLLNHIWVTEALNRPKKVPNMVSCLSAGLDEEPFTIPCINPLYHLLKISWRNTYFSGCPTYLTVVLNIDLRAAQRLSPQFFFPIHSPFSVWRRKTGYFYQAQWNSGNSMGSGGSNKIYPQFKISMIAPPGGRDFSCLNGHLHGLGLRGCPTLDSTKCVHWIGQEIFLMSMSTIQITKFNFKPFFCKYLAGSKSPCPLGVVSPGGCQERGRVQKVCKWGSGGEPRK